MPKYRLYIDEIGNSDLGASLDPDHRYLSLTGVIAAIDYAGGTLSPRIEDLKRRYFGSHPDEPIILHRKELVNQRGPFVALRDPDIRRRFDPELLQLLGELDYIVITAVIDKLEHLNRYRRWSYDPYHYCLTIFSSAMHFGSEARASRAT
jgi:hypothetical protein